MDEKESEIRVAATAVFDELVADLVLSTAISAHREIKRGRVPCGVCGTMCRSHTTASSSSAGLQVPSQSAGPSKSSSRGITPQPVGPNSSSTMIGANEGRAAGYPVGPEKGTGGGTGIGSGSGRIENGNAFFECLVCRKSIASNRYAPHLAGCLGLNGSTRRTAARVAASKARVGTSERSSPSPYLQASENGDSDGESNNGGMKRALNGSVNGSGKRGRSPGLGAIGLAKKSKLGSTTAPPTFGRVPHPPSKLGRPPTSRPIVGLSSPVSSPDKTARTLYGSQGSSVNGMAGGKRPPGMTQASAISVDDESVNGEGDDAAPPGGTVDGDSSSEAADDDY